MNRLFNFVKWLFGLSDGHLQAPQADPNVPWKRVAFFSGDPEPHQLPDISPVDAAAEMIQRRLKEMGADPDKLRMPIMDTDK